MVEGWGICLRTTETFVWPPLPPLVIQKIFIRLRFDLIEYKALPKCQNADHYVLGHPNVRSSAGETGKSICNLHLFMKLCLGHLSDTNKFNLRLQNNKYEQKSTKSVLKRQKT